MELTSAFDTYGSREQCGWAGRLHKSRCWSDTQRCLDIEAPRDRAELQETLRMDRGWCPIGTDSQIWRAGKPTTHSGNTLNSMNHWYSWHDMRTSRPAAIWARKDNNDSSMCPIPIGLACRDRTMS